MKTLGEYQAAKIQAAETTYKNVYIMLMELNAVKKDNQDSLYFWFYQAVTNDLKSLENVIPAERIKQLQMDVDEKRTNQKADREGKLS